MEADTEQPTVTVIIPAYNAADMIGRAIESALRQTVPPQEIIVVDDGSTDETAAAAARYPEVTVLSQDNRGPGAARNAGARVAKGDWLGLLDADDTWTDTKLERQLPYTRDPRVGLVYARRDLHPDYVRPTLVTLLRGNFIGTSSVLLRRSAFEEVGGFDEHGALRYASEDYNLWIRLRAAGWEFEVCPEDLHRYTPSPGSLSSRLDTFYEAEVANAAKLCALLGLGDAEIRRRRAAIYQDYGKTFLSERRMRVARRLFRTAFKEERSVAALGWWLVAWAPVRLLDARRRLRRRGQDAA
ncbi:MAG TPA: glycosyltransferase family A protein [Methylomirabilota bacterium]|jgi:glycosyltransferase involved in cell wall biosynthesis